MVGQVGAVGRVVLEYLGKYPDMPALRLATLIHDRHPELGTPDTLRSRIRYFKGKNGKQDRKRLAEHGFIETTDRPTNWRQLPESYAENWEPFRIAHAGGLRILLLSDIHFPYHDPVALNAALDHGHTKSPNIVLLNGDIQDCHEFGVYERDPRKRHVAHEIDCIRKFFTLLREEFPLARIIWKLGNHEERWERWMMRMAPALLDIPEFDLYSIMHCAEHGVEVITDKRVILAGKLNILHGHEFGKGGGVNPARWLMLKAGESAICGHFHRTSEHMDKTLSQSIVGFWSTGCLSEMHPMYLPLNRWNHGFAIVSVNSDGTFRVENHRIVDGTVY